MLTFLVFACLVITAAAQFAPTQSGPANSPCEMDNGETGECVQYYQCNADNSIITDGIGLIDIRFEDAICPSYLDVCCAIFDKRQPENPITPSPNVQPVAEGCGRWNKNGIGFKTTGDVNGEAKFGEFPWMVAILEAKPTEAEIIWVYIAGGSLIHPSVVLTSAHNVIKTKTLRVRAGEWDTQTTNEIYPHQERDVVEMIVHKDFNIANLFYDIALLFLKSPFDMAPNVGVACLPPSRERIVGGTRCFASGWGKDKFGKEGRSQVILKKVNVPVVEHAACKTALRKTRLGRYFELHTSFMCAGGEQGVDTCNGDGGSPLVCPIQYDPDRYVQSGIVSWGIGCGDDGNPGVYVDVSKLKDWIDDKVAGKGFDPKIYTY